MRSCEWHPFNLDILGVLSSIFPHDWQIVCCFCCYLTQGSQGVIASPKLETVNDHLLVPFFVCLSIWTYASMVKLYSVVFLMFLLNLHLNLDYRLESLFILQAASLFQGPVPPVVSFNMGSLGFMTPFSILLLFESSKISFWHETKKACGMHICHQLTWKLLIGKKLEKVILNKVQAGLATRNSLNRFFGVPSR